MNQTSNKGSNVFKDVKAPDLSPTNLKCNNCNVDFNDDEEVEQHKCIQCYYCRKTFPSRDLLIVHMERDEEMCPVLCRPCGGSPNDSKSVVNICDECVGIYAANRKKEKEKRTQFVEHSRLCDKCGNSFTETCVIEPPEKNQEENANRKKCEWTDGHCMTLIWISIVIFVSFGIYQFIKLYS